MKKNKYFLNFCFILILVGCGTDTGNPISTNPLPVNSSQPIKNSITGNLCSKITSCFGSAPIGCETSLLSTALISTHLGLNENTYADLNAVQIALDQNTLQVDYTKGNLCFKKIFATTCNDATVQQSYNPSSPQDMTQIWRLLNLDSNCNQFIF